MNRTDETGAQHRQTWDLIPWVVNGRASPEDRASVEAHLRSCRDCREEFAFQRRLHAAMNQDSAVGCDPAPDLRRLWARIDAAPPATIKDVATTATATMPRRRKNALAWALAAAVLVETIALAILAQAQWQRAAPAARYRTLSAPAAVAQGATIRAVMAPTLTLGELQALLLRLRLQIVDGPSEAGVYSLAPASAGGEAANAQVLAQLRADPAVRFAEPLARDSGQPR